MNINKISNVSFGRTFYLGLSIKNPNGVFYFSRDNISDLKKSSDLLLTDRQKEVTYKIEEQLFPDKFERKLDKDLEAKNTHVVYRYESDGNISLFLSKCGKNCYGKKYAFIPTNKDCTNPIKEVFHTKNITQKEIQEKTNRFEKDCRAYLNDDNNPINTSIEEDIYYDDECF